jgi:hypothetical protein
MKAYLRSLQIPGETGTGLGERHVMGEVEYIERLGPDRFVAGYKGRRYTAIYNPFVGAFFVDDVDGEVG